MGLNMRLAGRIDWWGSQKERDRQRDIRDQPQYSEEVPVANYSQLQVGLVMVPVVPPGDFKRNAAK